MKLEKNISNKKAQIVCRELRYQIANNEFDFDLIADLVSEWCRVTGNEKYVRPDFSLLQKKYNT